MNDIIFSSIYYIDLTFLVHFHYNTIFTTLPNKLARKHLLEVFLKFTKVFWKFTQLTSDSGNSCKLTDKWTPPNGDPEWFDIPVDSLEVKNWNVWTFNGGKIQGWAMEQLHTWDWHDGLMDSVKYNRKNIRPLNKKIFNQKNCILFLNLFSPTSSRE